MTRKSRLLAVAAACLALLGVAAVVIRAPEPTLHADDEGNGATGLPGGTDGSRPAGNDAVGTTSPSVPPGPIATPKSGRTQHGAVPTTTNGTAGTTTTTRRGGTTTTTSTGPKCPNPKTCDVYKLQDETTGGPHGGTKGWRPDPDGVVRIPFYVNPIPPQGTGITEQTMEEAWLEATRIIEAANPRLKFVYRGLTDRIPRSLDGYSDFAFGNRAIVQHDSTGHIREADIAADQYVSAGAWAYNPCEQRDGGCGSSGSGKAEIMTRIVHEVAHTVGLADLFGEKTTELTMDAQPDGSSRRDKVTLGRGDVLGIRALYPTSAPMPPIYAP